MVFNFLAETFLLVITPQMKSSLAKFTTGNFSSRLHQLCNLNRAGAKFELIFSQIGRSGVGIWNWNFIKKKNLIKWMQTTLRRTYKSFLARGCTLVVGFEKLLATARCTSTSKLWVSIKSCKAVIQVLSNNVKMRYLWCSSNSIIFLLARFLLWRFCHS